MTFEERLTNALTDNSMVSWIEPDDDPKEVVIWFASARDCVKQAKAYASEHGHTYASDEDALYDHIVVHWADLQCEYDEIQTAHVHDQSAETDSD